MKNRKCYLFVFDGFADWEPALAVSALNRFTDFEVVTFSVDGRPVRSFGNLQVVPDTRMSEVDLDSVDLLILPGGEAWDKGKNNEIEGIVDHVLTSGKTLAAICAATGFLARQGYLDNRKHTSNHLTYYLKPVAPKYGGEANYVEAPVAEDDNLITASGAMPFEFAEQILEHFNLFALEELSTWFGYFRMSREMLK